MFSCNHQNFKFKKVIGLLFFHKEWEKSILRQKKKIFAEEMIHLEKACVKVTRSAWKITVSHLIHLNKCFILKLQIDLKAPYWTYPKWTTSGWSAWTLVVTTVICLTGTILLCWEVAETRWKKWQICHLSLYFWSVNWS